MNVKGVATVIKINGCGYSGGCGGGVVIKIGVA